jgi:hypothetical protein
MHHSNQLTTTTVSIRNSISRSPLRRGFLLIPFALAWFALSPTAQAVDPPPDGGYPNFNTAEGEDALFSLTTGYNNTAIGFQTLYFNTTGFFNTAIGFNALHSNTTGFANTATGYLALFSSTIGSYNTANGYLALFNNTNGFSNTAIGATALYHNTEGFDNTATGFDALENNTTGFNNTANGFDALFNNFTGNGNTASGASTLKNNTTGNNNTANGSFALFANLSGDNNTANGANSLNRNIFGGSNTANGANALHSNTTGSSNIAVGAYAGGNLTTGDNNIDIGNLGIADEANTIRIGRVGTQTTTFVAGISGATVAGGVTVIVDANGHLGTIVSSERFKDEIKPMDKASEAILALKPVTFRYKQELDPEGIPQFGLVAEQVAKVNPDLVARDDQGKPYTVRYEAVNAMLLNEFLKEHRKVEEQQKEIDALASQLQKVSNQIELIKPAPRVVINQ